jgi:archaellum component FlaC
MGQGRGMGTYSSGTQDGNPISREDELDALKKQASDLKNQMEKIQDRIKDLEKKG